MAIDTRDKRTAVIVYRLPFLAPLNPAGASIGEEDRKILLGVYPGTLGNPPVDYSAIGLWLPFLRPWPIPDGTIGEFDRGHILGTYAMNATAPTHTDSTGEDRTLFRGMFRGMFRGF